MSTERTTGCDLLCRYTDDYQVFCVNLNGTRATYTNPVDVAVDFTDTVSTGAIGRYVEYEVVPLILALSEELIP